MRPAALLIVWVSAITVGSVPGRAEERVRWGDIDVEAAAAMDTAAWRDALDLEDRFVDEALLEPAIERGLRILAEAGYPFAEARPGGFDIREGRLTGTIVVDPGDRATIEAISPVGGQVTKPGTIARLTGIRPGDLYTGKERDLLRERMARSALFNSVGEVKLLPGAEPGSVVLEVPVTEPPYTRFRGALGVSGQDSRVTGLVNLDLANIAGTARAASGQWENRGDGLTRFGLSYREPWLPFVPLGLEGHLIHDVNEETYSYTKWEIAADLSWRYRWTVRAGRGGSQAVEVQSNRGKQTESFFVAGIGFDGRNSVSNPTAGVRFFVDSRRGKKTYTLAGDSTEVRVDRTRWNLGGEGYRRFGDRWLGVLRTAFDYLDTPEDSIPRWDLFAVGGAVSLRGYREEQFLTKGSWLVQSEWRWLQGDRGSAVYLFADGGFVSSATGRTLDDIFTTFLFGTGVGVRQAHKLGILVVEYGVPRGESPLDGRIHLRIDAVF